MRAGLVGASPDLLERAEDLARGLGRPREAAEFLFARRARYSQASRLDVSGPLSRRLLEQGESSDDAVVRALGGQAWGIHQLALGDIAQAFSYLGRSTVTTIAELVPRTVQPLRNDLRAMSLGRLAEATALHGDVDGARALLATMKAAVRGDPFLLTACAAFASTAARKIIVGLRYQNAKSVLVVAGNPLPVRMARSRARGEAR